MFENFSDSKIDLYIFWIFPHCPSIFYTRSNDEDIAVLHEKQWWRYCRFKWEAMMKLLPCTWEAMMKILPFYMRSNDVDIAVLHEKQWWRYCHLHEKQWWRYCRFTWEAMMKILPFFYSSSTFSLRHKYAQVTFIENPNKRFINFWIKIPGYIIHKWKEYLFKFFILKTKSPNCNLPKRKLTIQKIATLEKISYIINWIIFIYRDQQASYKCVEKYQFDL